MAIINVSDAVNALFEACINAEKGLPEELFLLVSSLTPIPNVDLFIRDMQGCVLLSRRNDTYYGQRWHIPGGCIRFGETMEHRLQETAKYEIGCEVAFDPEPAAVRDVLRGPKQNLPYPNVRGHNITILFNCRLPEGFEIDNGARTERDAGYLKWFSKIPRDLIAVQDVYNDYFERLNLR